ncbi:MAG: hypothetical protein M3069_28535 [Chloroflexota bacterium]|nr:hypothetical protein [Chloroflexota bacterium]
MNSARLRNWILPLVITLLALADGVLHFTLDVVLFRGNFIGRIGPPPGTPPPANPPPGPPVPLPLPVNQLFLLNLIGYTVLIALFWFALRRRGAWLRWVDLVLVVYALTALLAWVDLGRPNPRGLGFLSKGVEIVLVIALLAHAWMLSRTSASVTEPALELQTRSHS